MMWMGEGSRAGEWGQSGWLLRSFVNMLDREHVAFVKPPGLGFCQSKPAQPPPCQGWGLLAFWALPPLWGPHLDW